MARKLTPDERSIRAGRGIPITRFWPAAVILLGLALAAADAPFILACTGKPLVGNGAAAGAVHLATAAVCSPLLLRGSPPEWLLFAAIWAPLPLALLNWRWAKRHEAYWDGVRARERARRGEARARRAPGSDRDRADG